jgi:hypothetical protein
MQIRRRQLRRAFPAVQNDHRRPLAALPALEQLDGDRAVRALHDDIPLVRSDRG